MILVHAMHLKRTLSAPCSIFSSDKVTAAWQRGMVLAEGQNLARRLMEAPSNKMTPTIFSEEVKKQLQNTCSIVSR